VDTRKKILSVEDAGHLKGPVALLIGAFDVLRASHIRELNRAISDAEPRLTLLVAVVPTPNELLSQQARAELVAALRMVDYVVTTDAETADRLGELLMCHRIVRMDTSDESHSRVLKEHVRRRKS
jgi:bifunctional ADP-heptose synthase (sugar kinase/adenylyltransferase)